jgi:pilus assembly protein CpaC
MLLIRRKTTPPAMPARLALAIALFASAGAAWPQATSAPAARPRAATAAPVSSATPCGRVEVAPAVQIPLGKSTVVKPPRPVTRILLGNPDNARAARPAERSEGKKDDPSAAAAPAARPGVADVDVLLLGPNEVYLLGKTLGSTNMVMIDRDSVCTAFDVVVSMDVAALQGVLSNVLPQERNIRITAAFDSVVLSGAVSDSEALARVLDVAGAYVRGGDSASASGRNPRIVNMLEVNAPQQVMLEVKVAEVSKALIDKLGVQVRGNSTSRGDWNYGFLSEFLSGGNAAAAAIKLANGSSITVDAQKDDGMVKILAEPTIMAISGQTGSFLAGGKIFIPVSQDNNGTGGRTITLEEKEFGVSVRFTPTVLGNGRINLKVRPEVSELNRDGVGIVASGVTGSAILPSFTSRKAETTVQLMDGQSFAIGGLIKNNATTNIKAMPLLGELPVIGALFRSTDFQTDRSELVFVITPRLVKPLPADYRLPTDNYVPPTRSELMLEGRLEGRGAAAAAPAPAARSAPAGGGFDTQPVEKK